MQNLDFPFEEFNYSFFTDSKPVGNLIEVKNYYWRGTYQDALDFIGYCDSFQSFKEFLKKMLLEDSKKNWSSVYLDILEFWEKKALIRKTPWEKKFISKYGNWEDVESAESAEEEIEFGVKKILICNQVKQSIYLEMINWNYSILIFSALFFLFEEKFHFFNEKKVINEEKTEAEIEKRVKDKNNDEKILFYTVLKKLFSKDVQQTFYYFFENTPYIKNNFVKAKEYTHSFLISKYQRESFYSTNFNWTKGHLNFIIPEKDKESLTLFLGCFSDIENVKKMIPGLVTNDPVELQSLVNFLEDCSDSKVFTRFEKKIFNLQKLIRENNKHYFFKLSGEIEDFLNKKFDTKIDVYGRTFDDFTSNEIGIIIQNQELRYIAQLAYFLKVFGIENFKELAQLEKQCITKEFFYQDLLERIERYSLPELENYISRSFGKTNEGNLINKLLLSKETSGFIRNNFLSQVNLPENKESKKILVFFILAFITIIAQLPSLDPYRSSRFKNMPPPTPISADTVNPIVSNTSFMRGGADVSKSKSSVTPSKNLKTVVSLPAVSKTAGVNPARIAKVVTFESSAEVQKNVLKSETSLSSEPKSLVVVNFPEDEKQISRVVMFLDNNKIGILGKIVGVEKTSELKRPLSTSNTALEDKISQKPVHVVFYSTKGWKEIEKNFHKVVTSDGSVFTIGTTGPHDKVTNYSGDGLDSDHVEGMKFIIEYGIPVKRGRATCVLTTSEFNKYRASTTFSNSEIQWPEASQANSEDGSFGRLLETRRQDYNNYCDMGYLNAKDQKRLLKAQKSIENLGFDFSEFLENHRDGVLLSHQQIETCLQGTNEPMPKGTTGPVAESRALVHNARKPLSKIKTGLSLNNRESFTNLVVAGNNAMDIAARVCQCRNNYYRFPRCVSFLDTEVIGLRSDLEAVRYQLPDLCEDQETITASKFYIDHVIGSVNRSINSTLVSTSMGELHAIAKETDQIHISKGHHGDVSAKGFVIDVDRQEDVNKTIDQFFSRKSYTFGETVEKQKKKVESHPLTNLYEQHWQELYESSDSTKVVKKTEDRVWHDVAAAELPGNPYEDQTKSSQGPESDQELDSTGSSQGPESDQELDSTGNADLGLSDPEDRVWHDVAAAELPGNPYEDDTESSQGPESA